MTLESSTSIVSIRNLQSPAVPALAPQVFPDHAYGAELHCSSATVAALKAADLVRLGGGKISVALALVSTGACLTYTYFALALSAEQRTLVEHGFETLYGVARDRRLARRGSALPNAPVIPSLSN